MHIKLLKNKNLEGHSHIYVCKWNGNKWNVFFVAVRLCSDIDVGRWATWC